jgi:hypothetical protein
LGTTGENTPAVDGLRDFSADLCALELMGAAARLFYGVCWVFSALLFVLGGKQSINLYANGSSGPSAFIK